MNMKKNFLKKFYQNLNFNMKKREKIFLLVSVFLILLIVPIVTAPGTTTEEVQVFLIKSDDYTSEDYKYLQELQSWLKENLGISSAIVHNVQITKQELHDKIGVFIHDGRVILIIGDDVAQVLTEIIGEIENFLRNSKEIAFCDVLKNSELVSDDFKQSLCEGNRVCTDTDSGKDFYTYGEVKWSNEAGGSGTERDNCKESVLLEAYCIDNRPHITEYKCLTGCLDGRCIGSEKCKDSDGGLNYFVKGSLDVGCVSGCKTFVDYCVDGEKLLENYCSEGEPKEKISYCEKGCKEGRCVESEKCKDGDGGKNYYERGGVDFKGEIYFDYCKDKNVLIEKICLNEGLSVVDYNCPFGCKNGSCVSESCYDSDMGIDYYNQGILKLKHTYNTHTDSCINEKTLQEYYCPMDQGDYAVSHYYTCPEGCKEGKCIGSGTDELTMSECLDNPDNYWDQETDKCFSGFNGLTIKYLCKDPDRGKDYYTASHAYGFRSNYADKRDERIRTGGKDSCLPDEKVIEHYCDENGFIQTVYFRCPHDCKEDACIPGPVISEEVKCVFKNSEEEQECFVSNKGITQMRCKGKETCIAVAKGLEGEEFVWKSSCGGYAYTKIDGEGEYAEFECGGGERNITDIKDKGFRYSYWKCYGGKEDKQGSEATCKPSEAWKKHAEEFCKGHCSLGKCGVNTFSISQECYLGPEEESECGNGICESGEADYWNCPECEKGKLCMAPCEYIEGVCPEDCKEDEEKPVCGDGVCEGEESEKVCIPCKVGEDCDFKECSVICEMDCKEEEEITVCENSCPLKEKCYDFGYRKTGQYCSDEGRFVNQKGSNEKCDNNFECRSNVCINNQCISQGLIQRILDWFRRLFGGD
jgi:hypothetical protein